MQARIRNMPSENTSEKRSGLFEAGFTMLELVVSMSILTVLMGLGAYALFSYNRAQALTGGARQVMTDLRDAQVRAQAEVRTYRVVFDLGAETYAIQRFETATTPPPNCVSPPAPPCWVQVETLTLPDGIDISTADFKSTSGCLDPFLANEVYFCPRGVSSSGNLVIRSTRLNQDRQIFVSGLTARAELR